MKEGVSSGCPGGEKRAALQRKGMCQAAGPLWEEAGTVPHTERAAGIKKDIHITGPRHSDRGRS